MFELPEALLLARIQFAFTVSFHFLFPAITIGLASYLAVLEGLWLKTGREHYMDLFRYWIKIFALVFGMGVVSGIVMSYQFGTNWAVFSDKAGPIIGPLMAYEVLTAFFLEAGFLGVMLFGMNRVGRGLHFTATLMVALGTFVSAFWILSVNSWMHTPTGYAMNANGQFISAGSWLAIIFNPSLPYRLAHTLSAAYLTTAFIVGGVGAWHLLKDRSNPPNPRTRLMFSMAMWMAAIVAPVQIVLGDLHGLNTLEHQPVKVMAMEGHYQSHAEGAPLILFGIPNSAQSRMDHAIQIPKVSSLILKHDLNAPMAGLDTVPLADRPPVGIVFWAFRVMVGLGARPRQALRMAVAAPLCAGDGAVWVGCGAGGLDHDGGGPTALDHPWPAAHGRFSLTPGGSGRGGVAAGLRRRVLRRRWRGCALHPEADGQAARTARARSAQRARSRRRHHACRSAAARRIDHRVRTQS
jgi:cytochrome bd ubiquinol oxidase subunit I